MRAHWSRSSAVPSAATSCAASTWSSWPPAVARSAPYLSSRPEREHRVGLRHALGVGALARVEHVVEGDDAVLPLGERAAHEREIAVVLQAFLEIVAGQQVVEVAGLRARPALP